jgi:hypothetical protein
MGSPRDRFGATVSIELGSRFLAAARLPYWRRLWCAHYHDAVELVAVIRASVQYRLRCRFCGFGNPYRIAHHLLADDERQNAHVIDNRPGKLDRLLPWG